MARYVVVYERPKTLMLKETESWQKIDVHNMLEARLDPWQEIDFHHLGFDDFTSAARAVKLLTQKPIPIKSERYTYIVRPPRIQWAMENAPYQLFLTPEKIMPIDDKRALLSYKIEINKSPFKTVRTDLIAIKDRTVLGISPKIFLTGI